MTRVRGAPCPVAPARSGRVLELAWRRRQARCRRDAAMSERLIGHLWNLTCFELRSPYMYSIARWAYPPTLTVNARRASFGSPAAAFPTAGNQKSALVSATHDTLQT